MAEVKQKRTGLITSVILVVVLAISLFLFLFTYTSLQNQISTLNTEKSNLQADKMNLQTQVNDLRAPRLHLVNFEDTIYSSVFIIDYVTIKGTIFNSGSNSATDVVLGVHLYDSDDTLIKTEQIAFGTIFGKSYENFDLGYLERISGEGVDYVTTTLTHD